MFERVVRPPYAVWMALFFLGCRSPSPQAVILTTDIGTETDDQWALVHLALLHRDRVIDLRGVVTTHAPNVTSPASETSAKVAHDVVTLLDLDSPPPIVAGSSSALPRSGAPDGGPGSALIREVAREFTAEHRLRVLTIGAATDLGEALLLEPDLEHRIEVVAMGFNKWPEGGDPWNVKNDPRAYEAILASNAPLTVGDAAVCLRHLTQDAESASGHTRDGGAIGTYLLASFQGWLSRQEQLCRDYTGRHAWPLWDLVTVAHVLGLTESEEHGRPHMTKELTFDHTKPHGTLRWVTSIDQERLWDDFERRLRRVGSAGPSE